MRKYATKNNLYHWHRASRKLVDIEWLKKSVDEVNAGKKLKEVCKKAKLNNGTYREISKSMFKKLANEHNLELRTKPGRKPIEIDLNICQAYACLLYTSPSPRDLSTSRMPSSA